MKKIILNKSKQAKFTRRYFLIPIILFISALLLYVVYNDVRNKTIHEFNNQQLILAQAASSGITSQIDEINSQLNFLSSIEDIQENNEQGKRILINFYKNHSDHAEAITRVDSKGRILFTYPFNESVIGRDITYQKHVSEIIRTHKPVISDVFMAVQGYLAIAFHVPIMKGNEYQGSLAILIAIDKLGKNYLKDVKIGETGFAFILSENNVEIYCPISEHIGKTILENFNNARPIKELVKKLDTEEKGTFIYEDYGSNVANGKRHIVYNSVPLITTHWHILITVPEEEIYSTIIGFRNRLILIFISILVVMLIYFYSFAKARTILREEEKRKETERNLKESEQKLRNIVEYSTNMFYSHDTNHVLQFLSPQIKDILGYEVEEAKKKWTEFVSDNPINEIGFQKTVKAIETGIPQGTYELELVHKSGRKIFVEVREAPVVEYGKTIAIVGSLTDINERKNSERILKENEERYRIVAEHTGQLIYDYNVIDGSIQWAGSIEKITGYNFEEFKNFDINKWEGHIHPDDRPTATALLDESMKNKSEYNVDYRFRKKDGSYINVEDNGIFLYDTNNNAYRMLGTMKDITERKRNEDALKASEERFRNVYENTLIGIYRTTPDGKIIMANPALVKMLGYDSFKDLAEKNLNEGGFEPDYPRSDFVTLIKNQGIIEDLESAWIRKDDSIIYVRESAKAVRDKNGSIIYFDGIAEDITEQRKIQLELLESEARFRQVVEEAVEIIFTTDTNGYFTYVNPAGLKSCGFTLDELRKMRYLDLIEPNYKKMVMLTYMRQYKNKTEFTIAEIPFRTKSGEVKWYNQNARLIIKNDEVEGFYVIARDVSEKRTAETALRESEEKLRTFFETTIDGICATDRNDNITFANPRLAEMLGYTIDEMLKMNFNTFIHPDDISDQQKQNAERFKGKSNIYERKLLNKNGETIWVIVSASPLFEKDNSVKGSFGMFTDITEQKLAEEEIRKLYHGVEQSPASIIITDIKGNIEYVNEKFCEVTGYQFSEVAGEKPSILKSGGISNDKFSKMWDDISSGQEWRGELLNRKKNGELFWEYVSISPIINEKGSITNFISINEDITERKLFQEKLAKSEEQFRSTWENSFDGMRLTDKNGIIIEVNNAFCKLVNKNKHEIVNKNINVIYRDKDDIALEKYKRRFANNEIEQRLEAELKLWNGENKWVSLSNSLIEIGENKKLLLSIFRDISDQKKYEKEIIAAKEKAEASERLKTEFLAQMSHEIRTPINIISGNASFLKEELKDSIDNDFLSSFDSMDLASKRIIRTIDLILNMSEIQLGTFNLIQKEVDLHEEILEPLIREHKSQADLKKIELVYNNFIENSVIKCDNYCVTQIFANLIDNAIKYTHKGKVEVSLYKNEVGKFTFEVKDSGIGMSNDFMSRIFQPFAQETQGYSRKFEGNGLGLALVKKYSDYNNAEIEVESKKNVGSTFRVIFN